MMGRRTSIVKEGLRFEIGWLLLNLAAKILRRDPTVSSIEGHGLRLVWTEPPPGYERVGLLDTPGDPTPEESDDG